LTFEAARQGVPVAINRVGSMFTVFFTPDPVNNYATAKKADAAAYGIFFRSLLETGVYFPPSQFEAAFISTAHSEGDVLATIQSAGIAFAGLRP
jgi:glutamate-1-semialdehyde 2,1-aminomutase